MKIAFIGGGNMGEVMVAAVLDRGLAKRGTITVSDIAKDRLRYLEKKYGVAATTSNLKAATKGEVVVLAIKPQNLPAVMAELSGSFKTSQLVLSIIAGAKIKTLSGGLRHEAIARVMPNTPARIGEGMSVWTATAGVSKKQKKWAKAILGAMGKEVYVADEKYIDMATAISGSGPAYFFLMVEALVGGAAAIGLPRALALELVLETMLGSGHLVQRSGKAPAELRRMVTSPRGTTAAALEQLAKGRFADLVKRAVKAAYNRARELGG
jgi:pyrroline-5-carboxylate reductase